MVDVKVDYRADLFGTGVVYEVGKGLLVDE
jgi:hypothetical protein